MRRRGENLCAVFHCALTRNCKAFIITTAAGYSSKIFPAALLDFKDRTYIYESNRGNSQTAAVKNRAGKRHAAYDRPHQGDTF